MKETPSVDVGYTSFNKPKELNSKSLDKSIQFFYNPYDQRYKKIESLNGVEIEKTIYLDKDYEFIDANDKSISKYFIYANNELVAINITELDKDTKTVKPYTRYFHTNNIGSVEAITDARGVTVEKYKYTPYGKRTIIRSNEQKDKSRFTNRGFTGHEHIEEFNLIHMNGRLYDPELKRFLSPDPYIQNPYNPQNLNRYSYVMNNPFRYTDPSGYFFEEPLAWMFGEDSSAAQIGADVDWFFIGMVGAGKDTAIEYGPRVIGGIGGTLQIGTGGALLLFEPTKSTAVLGVGLISHGTNNIQEAISGNNDGWIRTQFYGNIFGKYRDEAYAGVDVGLGGLAGFRTIGTKTISKSSMKYGDMEHTLYQNAYSQMTTGALSFEVINNGTTLYQGFSE